MSPREHPMQVWMKGYVSRILSVNNQIATKATDDVFEFAEMAIPLLSFNEYGAGILLPLAHAIIDNWKGRDSISAFCFASKQFGIPSLEYISWLQVNGLDDGYADVIGDILGKTYSTASEVVERRGRSVWMACTAAYDVLYECLPRNRPLTSQEMRVVHPTVHNAKFLVENIRGEKFQYITNTARDQIGSECQAIVKEFGNAL